MLKAAIVEDESKQLKEFTSQLQRYASEKGQEINVSCFSNAITFLEGYKPLYDVIFMDIQMPYLDGMSAAEKLRRLDTETPLIFVTNMAQMAVRGYDVAAFDFIVKPVRYASLSMKMDRLLKSLSLRQEDKVKVLSEGTVYLLPVRKILYLEVMGHKLVYHTTDGDYPAYGTMVAAAKDLEGQGFSSCNKCYLVNLRHVKKVEKFTVTVGNDELQISHPKKKSFMEDLSEYIGNMADPTHTTDTAGTQEADS